MAGRVRNDTRNSASRRPAGTALFRWDMVRRIVPRRFRLDRPCRRIRMNVARRKVVRSKGVRAMAVFSVLVMTAAPPGQASEAGGAYVKIDGREALLRSVELFLNRDNVKQILLAVLPDMLEE